MKFDIGADELRRAKIPHELFLTNLIGNHILTFVVTIGMFSYIPWPIIAVPVVSVAILTYTLWRARRSLKVDPWYVKCHWQMAARRSKLFIFMLGLFVAISGVVWSFHLLFGMRDIAAFALIGGAGLLPVMVTILLLIVLESDGLNQADKGILPKWVVERFPSAEARLIGE